MKLSVGGIGSVAANSDVLFLHVFTPNKLFARFTQGETEFFVALDLQAGKRRRGSIIMAQGEDSIQLKFRIYDGTDIAHNTYASSMTVATLKQSLVAEWPQGKTVTPKSVNDVKLIHAGKVLENSKTLADSKITFGEVPAGVITMHVVVQPPVAKKKTDKNQGESQKQNPCSCAIL